MNPNISKTRRSLYFGTYLTKASCVAGIRTYIIAGTKTEYVQTSSHGGVYTWMGGCFLRSSDDEAVCARGFGKPSIASGSRKSKIGGWKKHRKRKPHRKRRPRKEHLFYRVTRFIEVLDLESRKMATNRSRLIKAVLVTAKLDLLDNAESRVSKRFYDAMHLRAG